MSSQSYSPRMHHLSVITTKLVSLDLSIGFQIVRAGKRKLANTVKYDYIVVYGGLLAETHISDVLSAINIVKWKCNQLFRVSFILVISGLKSEQPPTVAKPATITSHSVEPEQKTPPKSSGPFSGGQPSTPGTPGCGLPRVFPIQSLNPYQNRWTIRARVSQKSAIRTWSKQGRDGKLFNFTLVDESGEIRVTGFNAEVDKFYDMIEVNKVYYVSRANLKAANKQFNTTNNDYEMTLHSDSQVLPCEDSDTSSLPETHFNFISIGKLDTQSPGSFVDIVGVVHECGEAQTITAKASQRELRKRELGLVDSSNCLVRLTLWGEEAENFDGASHPVIVIKAAKISDFNGRSLSVSPTSSLLISPTNIPEAIRLKGWYEHEGRYSNFETFRSEMVGSSGGADGVSSSSGVLGGWNLLQDVKASGVGANVKADYFTCKATVVFMKKENFMYQACSTEGCNKKVIDLGNGLYRCEKCARETPDCKWRLLLMAKIADVTGDLWVTCFQDAAEALLGQTAEKLGTMKSTQDETQLEKVFIESAFNSWIFRLRAKVDRYNDEERLRVVVADVKPVDLIDYSRRLLKAINDLSATLSIQ
ncbi:replication factor A1 [Schistosoma bovis]|uniref:Replication protein A subunit n=1 Tax=Schistosoma bovis TaxID=6184 RepID=A0A430QRL4_SCHBO|nr:replication factor A1 [Schistosoma bovis]